MLVFLYGPDSFRRKERRDFYSSQFEKKYNIPAIHIDLATSEGPALFEEGSRSRSLFDARKLLVVENITEMPPKALLPIFKMFLEDKEANLLISEEKKPVKALDILLKKPVISETFEVLKGPLWNKFVESEARKRNVALDAAGLSYLAEAYSGDSWRLITELDKLAGFKRMISRKDLEELDIELGKDYFPLVNGLRASRLAARLWALESILSMNEPAAKVFNILAALWPQRAKDFSDYDKAIKFGRMDYEEALLDLSLS